MGVFVRLPMKSQYTVQEAARYVADATGVQLDSTAILDWGMQGFFGLYLVVYSGFAKYEHSDQAVDMTGKLVKFVPNAQQLLTLNSGYSIEIAEGLHDGRKVTFVKGPTASPWSPDRCPANFNRTSVVLIGTEIAAFVESVSASTPKTRVNPVKQQRWQEMATEIADRIDAADAKAGAHDSLKGIAARVAKELREKSVYGPLGPISEGTVLREALQGGRWNRRKQDRGNGGNCGEEVK